MKEKTRELKITEQETEVITLIAKGYTDHEIADILKNSYTRVRAIFATLQLKTGTINRPHLVSWAYRNGILK